MSNHQHAHALYLQGVDIDSNPEVLAVVLGTEDDAQAEADRRNLVRLRELLDAETEQHLPVGDVVRVDPHPIELLPARIDRADLDRAAAAVWMQRGQWQSGKSWAELSEGERDDLRTSATEIVEAFLGARP
jgi:hypothetical protein